MNELTGFEELPQSLVIDVFEQTKGIEQELLQSFEELNTKKEEHREQLINHGLLNCESNLSTVQIPTTCGVDGAYAAEGLLATDLVVIGAVAIEGFKPPSAQGFWSKPEHRVHIGIEPHNEDTISIYRSEMIGMELVLAQSAPHDLVLLDGSITTPIIFFNQGFTKALSFPNFKTKERIAKNIRCFLKAYYYILSNQDADRQWVAIPKKSSLQEIGRQLKWNPSYDDRALLSSVLEAGEYTTPIQLLQPDVDWNLNPSVAYDFSTNAERAEIESLKDQVLDHLKKIRVLYYRPRAYIPALRLEMSEVVANDHDRLSIVLQGIKNQYTQAFIMEPYPLYMADRMVKHLPQSLPACRHRISQNLAECYQGSIDEIFTYLHSYRTEQRR